MIDFGKKNEEKSKAREVLRAIEAEPYTDLRERMVEEIDDVRLLKDIILTLAVYK